jgi:hypothetical protein
VGGLTNDVHSDSFDAILFRSEWIAISRIGLNKVIQASSQKESIAELEKMQQRIDSLIADFNAPADIVRELRSELYERSDGAVEKIANIEPEFTPGFRKKCLIVLKSMGLSVEGIDKIISNTIDALREKGGLDPNQVKCIMRELSRIDHCENIDGMIANIEKANKIGMVTFLKFLGMHGKPGVKKLAYEAIGTLLNSSEMPMPRSMAVNETKPKIPDRPKLRLV